MVRYRTIRTSSCLVFLILQFFVAGILYIHSFGKSSITTIKYVTSVHMQSNQEEDDREYFYCHPGHNSITAALDIYYLTHCPIVLVNPSPHQQQVRVKPKTVAIGCAITTRNVAKLSPALIGKNLTFFDELLPSFCKTASEGFNYTLYLAYDNNDPILSTSATNLHIFNQSFNKFIEQKCLPRISVALKFVQCTHSGKPAWAQNDAMMAAYMDGMEFYYRINDDTILTTKNWTEKYIEGLSVYNPPNIGVVGPNHSGGNEAILTYDFVHRSHVETFGYYYPRTFPSLYADVWIMWVYTPGRYKKIKDVSLDHTQTAGCRYSQRNVGASYRKLKDVTKESKKLLERTLSHYHSKPIGVTDNVKKLFFEDFSDNQKINLVCMYMSGKGEDENFMEAAIRTIAFMTKFMPTWFLRVYVPYPDPVARQQLDKLRNLGAQIALMTGSVTTSAPPELWPFLAIDDPDVNLLLVWDATQELFGSEYRLINDWLTSSIPAMCTFSPPPLKTISPSLFGGRAKYLRTKLKKTWLELMNYGAVGLLGNMTPSEFMEKTVLPTLVDTITCQQIGRLGWTKNVGDVLVSDLTHSLYLSHRILFNSENGLPYDNSSTEHTKASNKVEIMIEQQDVLKREPEIPLCINLDCYPSNFAVKGLNLLSMSHNISGLQEKLKIAKPWIQDNIKITATRTLLEAQYFKENYGIDSIVIHSHCPPKITQWAYRPPDKKHGRYIIQFADSKEIPDDLKHFFKTFQDKLKGLRKWKKVNFLLQLSESAQKLHLISKKFSKKKTQAFSEFIFVPMTFQSDTFCELYSSHVPLFIPSVEFMVTLHLANPKTVFPDAHKYIDIPFHNSTNSTYRQKFKQWLSHADFYQKSYISYFSNIRDLITRLLNLNVELTNRYMYYHTANEEWNKEKVLSQLAQPFLDQQ